MLIWYRKRVLIEGGEMDWKEIVEVIKQPILVVDKSGLIIFSNKSADSIGRSKLEGLHIHDVFNKAMLESSDNAKTNLLDSPIKISKIIKDDNVSVIIMESHTLDESVMERIQNDTAGFGFYGTIDGDFLVTTKNMRLLMNVDSQKMFVPDGWDKFINIIKDVDITGYGMKRMFETSSRVVTEIPTGPVKNRTISWKIMRYTVDGENFILGSGFEIKNRGDEIESVEKLIDCFDDKLIPAMILSADGFLHANPSMNLDLFSLGKGLTSDLKKIFPEQRDRERIHTIMEDVSSDNGRMLDLTLTIRSRDYKKVEYAARVYNKKINDRHLLIVIGVPIDRLSRKIEQLERKEKVINLYNIVLNFLVRVDDVKTALTLITGELGERLSSISTCLREVSEKNNEMIWDNCQFRDTGLACPIGQTIITKALSSGRTQITSTESPEKIYVVVPICLDISENYVICMHFKKVSPDMVSNFSDLRKIIEIGLIGIKTRLELLQKTNHLEKLNQFRSDILEAVNHDLRTPLTSIIGYAEILQMGILGEEEIKESIDSIKNSGEHLNRLIDDLSKYTSMVAVDNETTQSTVIDICSFVVSISKLMTPIFSKADIEYSSEIPEEPIYIEANKTKLEQVLINILGNASKFTQKGGKVFCGVERIAPAFIKLSISDNGPGVPADDKKRIFTKYGRVDVGKDGKGLGLFLSKKYIESIGGSIWLSSPGEYDGASFYLTLRTCKRKFGDDPQGSLV
jgi:signal transduction histidine kinase